MLLNETRRRGSVSKIAQGFLLAQQALVDINVDNAVSATDLPNSARNGFYGSLPGSSGDYFSTPDSAAASVTGSISLRFIGAADDWTPTGTMTLIGKEGGSSARSYLVQLLAAGTINLVLSVDGTATASATSSVATGFTDGVSGGIRADWDDTTKDVTFYTSTDDGETWSQLGTTGTINIASINDSASALEIGSRRVGTVENFAGNCTRAQVYSGSTLAVDFYPNRDFSSGSTMTSSTTSEVWTQQGNARFSPFDLDTAVGTAANLKLHPTGSCLKYASSSDYLSVPNAAINGNLTFTIDINPDDWTSFLIWDNLSATDGFRFGVNASDTLYLTVRESSTSETLNATAALGVSDNTRHTIKFVFVASTSVEFYVDDVKVGDTVVASKNPTSNSRIFQFMPAAISALCYGITITDSASTTYYDMDPVDAGNSGSTTFVSGPDGPVNYTSDFSSGADGWVASNGTVAGNIDSIGGLDDWLRLTVDSTSSVHQAIKSGLTSGKTYRLDYTYYIPSTNDVVDGARFQFVAGVNGETRDTLDTAVTVSEHITANATSISWVPMDGGSTTVNDPAGDDVIYIRGITFTEVPQWTLNGNSFIQNSGHQVLHSIGSAGLETAVGQTISGPLTIFVVARFSNAAPSTNTNLFAAKSNSAAEIEVFTNNGDSDKWYLIGGATLGNTSTYDTEPHLHTIQFNDDATTKYSISGLDSVTGNAGSEDWEYGTIMANRGGTGGMEGYFARKLVFNSALNELQINQLQAYFNSAYRL